MPDSDGRVYLRKRNCVTLILIKKMILLAEFMFCIDHLSI